MRAPMSDVALGPGPARTLRDFCALWVCWAFRHWRLGPVKICFEN
jgi:hypothetical protein